MSMKDDRRKRFEPAPIPTAWAPVATAAMVVLLITATPLATQTTVLLLRTGTLAHPIDVVAAYAELARGQFGGGLDRPSADALPADLTMWVLSLIAELIVVVAALVMVMWAREVTGRQSTPHGLATPQQAARALGLPRLRASAAVVRPDLHQQRPERRWTRTSTRTVQEH